MADFMIRFLICNILLCSIIGDFSAYETDSEKHFIQPNAV